MKFRGGSRTKILSVSFFVKAPECQGGETHENGGIPQRGLLVFRVYATSGARVVARHSGRSGRMKKTPWRGDGFLLEEGTRVAGSDFRAVHAKVTATL